MRRSFVSAIIRASCGNECKVRRATWRKKLNLSHELMGRRRSVCCCAFPAIELAPGAGFDDKERMRRQRPPPPLCIAPETLQFLLRWNIAVTHGSALFMGDSSEGGVGKKTGSFTDAKYCRISQWTSYVVSHCSAVLGSDAGLICKFVAYTKRCSQRCRPGFLLFLAAFLFSP